jgi:conjugal transfer pilus assembly protein TraV
MKHATIAGMALALTVLSGCSSLSGLDAKDAFTCKATGGVSCESMTHIYNRTQAGTLPAQQTQPAAKAVEAQSSYRSREAPALLGTTMTSGQPLRSQQQVVRLWIAPWIDVDGDLHDASYVYMSVGQSRWLIEHTRQQIMTSYGPRRAVAKETTALPSNVESSRLVTPGGVTDIGKDPAAAEIIKRMMGGQAQ